MSSHQATASWPPFRPASGWSDARLDRLEALVIQLSGDLHWRHCAENVIMGASYLLLFPATAFTMATMPCLTAPGSLSHAAMTIAKSGWS